MRHQERIYIQNKHTGPRNVAVPNVSLSSDLCVFNSPSFDISGATKIGSISGNVTDEATKIVDSNCSCPVDFILDIDGVTCVKEITTSAIYNGQIGNIIESGDTNSSYSIEAYFFPEIDLNSDYLPLHYIDNADNYGKLQDQNLQVISPLNKISTPFWAYQSGDTNYETGRLNNVGVKAYENEWVGFTACVTIDEPGIYYVGIGADNFCQFKIGGTMIFDTGSDNDLNNNFTIWSVFPVYLKSGATIIEMRGKNKGATETSFGAEIYHPSSLSALTGATNETEAGVIFSTKDKIGSYFDSGETIGYKCVYPYILSNCTSSEFTCVRYERQPCEPTIELIPSEIPKGVFISDPSDSITVSFNFTGNTESFTGTPASFNYQIYKFDTDRKIFITPAVFESESISYTGFQETNVLNDSVPLSELNIDGEYLVKGYYEFDVCTDFLRRLGRKINTSDFKVTGEYQLYDSNTDFYFIAIERALSPKFISNTNLIQATSGETNGSHSLTQQIIPIESDLPISVIPIEFDYQGDFLLILNGVILSYNLDYTHDDSIISLSGEVTSNDVVSVIFNNYGNVGITSDSIHINSIIQSGATGTHGSNNYFYNTTTGMYEVYCSLMPLAGHAIIVTVNAVTLTTGVDFFQSITDSKRIILNGILMIGDVINIVYFPAAEIINGVNDSDNTIAWSIDHSPYNTSGNFTLELSKTNSFDTLLYSKVVPYEVGVSIYNATLKVSGNAGDTIFYRVKNKKDYKTLSNNVISTVSYSEVVPIKITSNSVNSY